MVANCVPASGVSNCICEPWLLTVAIPCGKRPPYAGLCPRHNFPSDERYRQMVKPEWGTKRTCPKCGTRFYDLGEEDPVACINSECGAIWEPEPVLKSKQPVIFDDSKKTASVKKDDADLSGDDEEEEDLAAGVDEDAEINPDDEVDLGGDDDLQVDTSAAKDGKEDDT